MFENKTICAFIYDLRKDICYYGEFFQTHA